MYLSWGPIVHIALFLAQAHAYKSYKMRSTYRYPVLDGARFFCPYPNQELTFHIVSQSSTTNERGHKCIKIYEKDEKRKKVITMLAMGRVLGCGPNQFRIGSTRYLQVIQICPDHVDEKKHRSDKCKSFAGFRRPWFSSHSNHPRYNFWYKMLEISIV